MTEFQVTESIEINVPVAQVWERIKDFHDFTWAANMVKVCEPVGSTKGTEVGAQRIANKVFHETLTEFDARDYRIGYHVTEGPSPLSSAEISGFNGLLRLEENGVNGTRAVWSASWQGQDEAGLKFCKGMYRGLLKELSSQF